MLGEDELNDVMNAGALLSIFRQMESIALRHPEIRQQWLTAVAAARVAVDAQWQLADALLNQRTEAEATT